MPTTLPSFTKQERNKMRKVVKILRENFAHHMQKHGANCYVNDHGGCANCGDTSGFHGTVADLELLLGLRKPS